MSVLSMAVLAVWVGTSMVEPASVGLDPRSLFGVAGAPVVLALVQVLKEAWPALPSRYIPLLVLVVAVLLNVGLAVLIGFGVGLAIVVGLVTGLTASGVYSWSTAGRGNG